MSENKEVKEEQGIERISPFGLRAWRIAHGYITPEWIAYTKAVSELNTYVSLVAFLIGIGIGYLRWGM